MKVLVVGGGVGGMIAAMLLRRADMSVDLVDVDPEWRAVGAGMTITAPTLRALGQVGLLEVVREKGTVSRGTRLRRYTGELLGDIDEPGLIDGKPASGGILRPVFHSVLSDAVLRAGVHVRLGITVNKIAHAGNSTVVEFSDTTTGRYDLVIGADGIYSKVRALIFEHPVTPKYAGQGCWRMLVDRPEELDRVEVYLGHRHTAGITPCAKDKAYVWVNTTDPTPLRPQEDELADAVRTHLADFHGNLALLRERINAQSAINYRPFESALQPAPWHVGHTVLLGDAAHATTPHLASGAGMAIEDAIVLADEFQNGSGSVEERLKRYTVRRFDRCRFIVERSMEICELQKTGKATAMGQLTSDAMRRLSAPL